MPEPQLLTDGQLAVIVTAAGAIAAALGGAIRWGVGRIVKSMDDGTDQRREQTKADVELAKAMTLMASKVDEARNDIAFVRSWVEEHTPVGGTEQPPELRDPPRSPSRPITPQPRARTNPGGVPIVVEKRRTRDEDR